MEQQCGFKVSIAFVKAGRMRLGYRGSAVGGWFFWVERDRKVYWGVDVRHKYAGKF